MEISKIKISNSGYVDCKSAFYSVADTLNNKEFGFKTGANILIGDIDSSNFAISYFISMFDKVDKRCVFEPLTAMVNDAEMQLSELHKYSCYLDDSQYKLFSSLKTVKQLISQGLKKSKMLYSLNDICDIFQLSSDRIERPIKSTGNERYQAMAAVGFSFGKQVFCFPWFSKTRYKIYKIRFEYILKVLGEHKKIAILPLGE